MIKDHLKRLVGAPKRTLVVTAALASLALAGLASPALAAPKAPYQNFVQCPLSTSGLTQCLWGKTSSGEFDIGVTKVPINKPIVIQGGTIFNEATEKFTFVGAANGETITKVPLTVPGGILGIVAPESWPKWLQELFNEFINKGPTGVTATTELAGPASSILVNEEALLLGEGTAFQIPVKVELGNQFLGENCYIGSNSNPVILNLTTGKTSPPPPNKSISGAVGNLEVKEGGALVTITENSLVDNAWAAPGVTGCGGILSFLIDPAVDAKLGLPSAAGKNTAILKGTLEVAAAEAVKASE